MANKRFYFFSEPIYSSGIRWEVERGNILPEPVISLGHKGEWDCRRVQLFGTVLFDKTENRFRMWYLGMGEEPEMDVKKFRAGKFPYGMKQGYAESKNGIHWEKPVLGQVKYKGSRENNILHLPPAAPGAPYVIEDPEAGEHPHRYKLILTHGGGGVLAFSRDGINWEPYDNAAVLFTGGDKRGKTEGFDYFCHEPYVFIKDNLTDDINKRYRIYTQASSGLPGGWMRRTGLVYSPDARNWKIHPEPVMGLPDGMRAISGQIHGLALTIYKGYYVAFIHFCLPHPQTGWFAPRVHLALSGDGEHFQIFEDEDSALIPLGPRGGWYEGGVVSGSLLSVKNEFWCYFSGLPVTACWSGGYKEADERPLINTGLAAWNRDRILSTSLKPGFSEGYLLLKPLVVEAGRKIEIIINANIDEPQNGLKVSLLDAQSRLAIPGFSFEQFSLQKIDKFTLKGKWEIGARIDTNNNVIPCLQLRNTSARLYSAEFIQL